MHDVEDLLVQLAGIIVLGVCSQYVAHLLKLPSIIVLLLVGLVVGPVMARLGWPHLNPDDLLGDLLMPVVSLSVALILYEGGLTLRLKELPGVGGVVGTLVTVGALLTWIGAAIGARYIVGFDWPLAVLLGAILVVTGPTVVNPLVRHIKPSGTVGPILRWEGIVIDPIGAMLAVLVFEYLIATEEGGSASLQVVAILFRTIVIGGGLGLAGATLLVLLLKKYWVPDALANPVSMAIALAAFVGSNLVQAESGLLAATVMGIALANQRWVDVAHIVEFKESLRALLLGILFILLGARVNLDAMLEAGLASVAFAVLLILLVRPISVFASTIRSPLNWRQRAFIGWMAPRGVVAAAVSSVFSIALAGSVVAEGGGGMGVVAAADQPPETQDQIQLLVSVTFVVIVVTVAVYGLTAPFLARRLKLAVSRPQGMLIAGAHSWARDIAAELKERGVPVLLVDTNRQNIVEARLAGLDARSGGILAEDVVGALDLTGIGRLLALTPNDEVNALAAQRFLGHFGRAEVYRLSPGDSEEGADIPHGGRVLFGKDVTFAELAARFESGAALHVTPLSEEFDYDDYLDRYARRAIPLFVFGTTGGTGGAATGGGAASGTRVRVVAADETTTPQPGQSVMALISPEPEPVEHPEEMQPSAAPPQA